MRRNSPVRALISAVRLRARVRALGRTIGRDYRGKDLVLVGVLQGSFIFMADLARAIPLPLSCDFLRVSSYAGTKTAGAVRFELDLKRSVKGRHVLLVEDIIDTGHTAQRVIAEIRKRRPASVRLCTLLHKPAGSRVKVPIEYVGFTVPDRFVVGYGLDHDGVHRNLPYVGVLGNGSPA